MLYRVAPAAASPARVLRLQPAIYAAAFLAALVVCAATTARAQGFAREVDAPGKLELRVKNRTGRVTVEASDEQKTFSVSAASAAGLSITERDVRVSRARAAWRSWSSASTRVFAPPTAGR